MNHASILALLMTARLLSAPSLSFTFDGHTDGHINHEPASAVVAGELAYTDSPEGQAIVMGDSATAVRIGGDDLIWQPQGALGFWFKLPETFLRRGVEDRLEVDLTLLRSPVVDISLRNNRATARLAFAIAQPSGERFIGEQMLSRLEAGKWYHLLFTWDLINGRSEVFLNGILQSPMSLTGEALHTGTAGELRGALVLPGNDDANHPHWRIAIDTVERWDAFLTPEQAGQLLEGRPLPPLEGEGRTIYSEPLDLSAYELNTLYAPDLDEIEIVTEDSLFDGEVRARLPEPGQWVVEGKGSATVENGELVLRASLDPADASTWIKDGHLVVWPNRVFPENILIEYEIVPYDDGKGLNICFFAASPNNGADSIFDLSMKKRHGHFQNYLWHDMNSYHTSVWASPLSKRRTTNMRKNKNFYLTAVGNDHITGRGPGPHKVRILKDGGKIRAETNGIVCMAYDDDGERYGPVLGDGYIGIRMMGQSVSMKVRHFHVSELIPKEE